MNIPSKFLQAPPNSAEMNHNKCSGFIKKRIFCWIIEVVLMELALFATMTSEEKVEAPSSDIFCISDCATCPVICSPPPPILITKSYPPPSPSLPHSPPPSYFTFSPPPHKSYSPPPPPPPTSISSGAAPPPPPSPPFNSYNTPHPTVVAGPHDFSYPYYYFYASAASSLSIHASFSVSLLFLISYFILGNYY